MKFSKGAERNFEKFSVKLSFFLALDDN